MQWSDVITPPPRKMLRQFGGLCLVVFLGLAGYRAARGHVDAWTVAIGVAGGTVGIIGLVRPGAIRWVYTSWMIAAFPIGWTVSRLVLLALFYAVFTPVALVFRLLGRDALRLKAPASSDGSLWAPKPSAQRAADYLRQF